jgi:predicted TIM-barrel fold metal-dependent hydrolase
VSRRPDRHDPDRPPALPFRIGPVTNGEFVPAPRSRADVALEHAILDLAGDAARRNNMDRRQFLQSAGGVAAALAVLSACSSGGGDAARRAERRATSTVPTTGGGFTVPAPEDVVACEQELGTQGEFIFDVHTHHVMPGAPWRQNAPETVGLVMGMLPPDCAAADPLECANRESYLHSLFLTSDTTVAMLSDVPSSGPDDAPVPYADAVGTKQLAAALTKAGAPRVLLHDVIAPNFGTLEAKLDEMSAHAEGGDVAAFKLYNAYGPNYQGYRIDDPAIGLPVVQRARDLGVKTIIAHKGLPLVAFDESVNGPDDMVAASRLFPDMNFVIFHAAWDSDRTEGPYDPNASRGIDTVLAALDRHQVPPNSNVYVDIGTVWRVLLTRPNEAAHAIGKLLQRVGVDRVLWGTDAVWYGSPQPQIMAWRTFQIGEQLQAQYFYPALTDEVKRKVFGLNAAALFGIDPEEKRCALTGDPLAAARPTAAALRDEGYLASPWRANGPTTRREMLQWLASPTNRWTPA